MAEPKQKKKVVGFICQWCTSGATEYFGSLKSPDLPVNVDLVRLPCTGNVDPAYILRAFLQGADGVFVSGCHPGDCHYATGNFHARRRIAMIRALLDHFGIARGRLSLSWIATGEIRKFRDTMWRIASEAEQGEESLPDRPDVWRNI